MFESFHHTPGILKLHFCLFQIIPQDIIIHIKLSLFSGIFFREMHIIPNIDIDTIIIDGIADKPMIGSRFSFLFHFPQSSVGNIHQVFGYGHADEHAVHFVGRMVFAWPPNTGTYPLVGRSYKVFAVIIPLPSDSTIPWRSDSFLGLAFVTHDDFFKISGNLFFGQVDKMSSPFFPDL